MLAPNLWLYVTLGAVAVGGLASAYVKGRSDGQAIEVAQRSTLDEVARESREAAMDAAGEAIAKLTVNHTTIRQKAEVIVREVPVYRDCINDDRVIRMLDAARANQPYAESVSGGQLPGVGASATQDVR